MVERAAVEALQGRLRDAEAAAEAAAQQSSDELQDAQQRLEAVQARMQRHMCCDWFVK